VAFVTQNARPATLGLRPPNLAGNMAGMAININDSTAALVNKAIEQSDISETQLSEATHIARSTLQRKRAGMSKFTVDELYAIAQALGIKTAKLLPEELLAGSSKGE